MGYAGGSYVFNGVAKVVIELHEGGQLTEEAETKILTHVANELSDQDWDTLDESYDAFPGNPMVESALRDVWPEIGCAWEDSTDAELDE